MNADHPYVVVVTGPSAGVGKSTLATNLAIYLKGLAEDLPVAYLPLDVDAESGAMFHLGSPAKRSIAELDQVNAVTELFSFGQFGVDYCAAAPAGVSSPAANFLRVLLAQFAYAGVVILDVGQQSPYWQTALWAADLLLTPVRDPASLAELTAIRHEFKDGGGEDQQLWLLPSQLGELSQERPHLELEDFLRFAADERGFQVLKETLPAETAVHEQARAARPVLTRVPESRTHQQLRQIAELLLAQRQTRNYFSVRLKRAIDDKLLPARAKRIGFLCPLCDLPVWSVHAHYLEAAPSRRRQLVHQSCLALLFEGLSATAFQDDLSLVLLQPGQALGGTFDQLQLQVIDRSGEPIDVEMFRFGEREDWPRLLFAATGRQPAELYAETILLSEPQPVSVLLKKDWYLNFLQRRGRLKQLCRVEKL